MRQATLTTEFPNVRQAGCQAASPISAAHLGGQHCNISGSGEPGPEFPGGSIALIPVLSCARSDVSLKSC